MPETQQLIPPPVHARHIEKSLVISADDDTGAPTPALIELALDAARLARHISLAEISRRMRMPPYYPDVWPGEHYRLLTALVTILQPRLVVEIGTSTGLSALALKQALPPAGRLITYDLHPWKSFPDTVLTENDFADQRLTQSIGDLVSPQFFSSHAELLRDADLIFIDAAKDGSCERHLISNFRQLSFTRQPLFIFDDIRLWNMLAIWREISLPKLDLTSFGHWSGTGLVEWVPRR